MTRDVSSDIEIAVTGNKWMGKGTGSILTLMREIFSESSPDEIQIATYSVTDNDEFFDILDDVLTRKTRVLMIVNRFDKQYENVKEKLLGLTEKHKNFVLKDFNPTDAREDLHAKLVVIDHRIALVGSANLTWKGMVMNHELMVKLSGDTANSVGELIDRLSKHCKRVSYNTG